VSLLPHAYDELRRDADIPVRVVVPALLVVWLVPGLLASTETIAFWRMSGLDHPTWRAFASEAPPWLVYAALTPLILRLGEALPLGRRPMLPKLLAHLVFALGAGLLYATAASLCTTAFSPQLPDLTFGTLVFSWYLSALPLVVMVWFGVLGAGRGMYWFAQHRRRQVEAARLTAQLAEARLGALRMQLHPHFLFNSLNALGVLVRDGDVEAAENVLDLLAELLRESLRMSGPARIPLAEETDFLRRYLEIEQIRFPDRLRVSWDVPRELHTARVPALILQPLVENAMRHGIAPAADAGRLSLSARREGGTLVLVVEDDGVGMPPENRGGAASASSAGDGDRRGSGTLEGGSGLGLANVRERLEVLYGSASTLEVTPAPEGGTRATIRLPLEHGPVDGEEVRVG
jgi:signal transduction histidine kinase